MEQAPVYRHISELDKINNQRDLIETNRLISVLGLGKKIRGPLIEIWFGSFP